MTSALRRESRNRATLSRGVLMRTAATVVVAASPFLYSGAAAAATSSAQLVAPTIKGGKLASKPQIFSIASTDAKNSRA